MIETEQTMVKKTETPNPLGDKAFIAACKEARVKPSKRQYTKWIKGKGIARLVKQGQADPLPKEWMHQPPVDENGNRI